MRNKSVLFSVAINLVVLLALPGLFIYCSNGEAQTAGEKTDWKITIAPDDEPGEVMVISGVVYGPDGKTPQKDVDVYVYHTDIRGYYSTDRRSGSNNPRLKGTMRTGADGKYEYRTIRPGPYPEGGVAAHVHYVVSRDDDFEQGFELLFEGDRFLSEDTRKEAESGNFFEIISLRKDDEGIWRGVFDLVLEK